MKNRKNDYDWTTNRNYYNKLRKHYLESVGEIRCSYCKYNKGENSTQNWYGGFEGELIKYPSWKLVSKNRKQWMEKEGYKITESLGWRGQIVYEVIW